ncbi:MAG TPA: DNA-binding transcriptional regulator Fis [Gammaproteobacteria bacterium]|nr:DNA-binding transcriptional regulator Fis [Gammaproteobacteria bacterium]
MIARTGTKQARAASRKHNAKEDKPLAEHVRDSLERYFDELNGQSPGQLYDLVLSEVEQPLLEVVMAETRGNVSKAAAFLGLNRATLRKKLQKYGLND